jgi:hypothetical protein
MTRPKVPDDKRQRTAQACDSCKRRKQKVGCVFPTSFRPLRYYPFCVDGYLKETRYTDRLC